MTTIKRLDLDLLVISGLRPEGVSIPVAEPDMIVLAQQEGPEALMLIKARPKVNGQYEILSGITTWRVAQWLAIMTLDVQVLDMPDDHARQLVCQDFARADARRDPAALGWFLRRYCEEQGVRPTDAGRRLGLTRRDTSLYIRLTRLDPQVLAMLRDGLLSLSLARCLITIRADHQVALANKARLEQWSVRQMEHAIHQRQAGVDTARQCDKSDMGVVLPGTDFSRIMDEEKDLSENLNSSVEVHHRSQGDGYILIHYHGLDVYSGIAERLRQIPTQQNEQEHFCV